MEEDVLKALDEWLAVIERKDISIFYTARKRLVNVDELDRGLEKTQFSGTLERHKVNAENEDGGCWVGHLRPGKEHQ